MPIGSEGPPQKPEQLLSMLSSELSERSLFYIAAHDRGTHEQFERHLEELVRIRNGSYFIDPKTHYWYPLEVIELASWSDWDREFHPHQDMSPHDFHIMRAFCCSIMLYIAGQHAYDDYLYTGDSNEALIQLINSIDMLPASYIAPTLDLLMWRLADPERCNGNLAYLAISAIYLHLKTPDEKDESLLESLSEAALTAEDKISQHPRHNPDPGWLLPLTGSLRKEAWQAFFLHLSELISEQKPDMTCSLYELSVQLGS